MTSPVAGATIRGFVAPGFESVAAEFARNFSHRGEVGAAFAAVSRGETVVDLWGGTADAEAGRSWQADTLLLVWSGTKGFVAVCMLLLVDRGELDLDAPVARYWPEFARNGKKGILVSHVLSHTAGLPGLRQTGARKHFLDPRAMSRRLEAESPLWQPGQKMYYHAHTYGWLCGELLRRIDGRSLGQFFSEEVAAPLGLEIWIGLPLELEPRVGKVQLAEQWNDSAPDARPTGLPSDVWTGPPLARTADAVWNTRAFHAAELPSTNGIASARSIARLYGCLAQGGEIDGVRLISRAVVTAGTKRRSCGVDPDGKTRCFGSGFELQTPSRPFGREPSAFGHGGAGGSLHGAWPKRSIGFSYVMNDMRNDPIDERIQSLLTSLHQAVAETAA